MHQKVCGLQYSLSDLFHHKYCKARNRQAKISTCLKIQLYWNRLLKTICTYMGICTVVTRTVIHIQAEKT